MPRVIKISRKIFKDSIDKHGYNAYIDELIAMLYIAKREKEYNILNQVLFQLDILIEKEMEDQDE